MATVALFVRLNAKPTKAQEVAELLTRAQPMVEDEPATSTWYAVRFGVTTFGIFDTFDDEAGRRVHLTGRVAAALKENEHLFEDTPVLETADILAEKVPVS
jgi:quinol monooxygenase YgiN